MIDIIRKDGMADKITDITGLIPDAYFSATKIKWILDNVRGARGAAKDGRLLFGTVDTWLIWNLTKGKVHATDYTNASRTMILIFTSLNGVRSFWNILIFRQPCFQRFYLPVPFTGIRILRFRRKICISGVAGDQQAALFGQCCFEEGEAKIPMVQAVSCL